MRVHSRKSLGEFYYPTRKTLCGLDNKNRKSREKITFHSFVGSRKIEVRQEEVLGWFSKSTRSFVILPTIQKTLF
ncbi:MAG: hypothetical protein ACJAWV_001340 [Flammeovirgaceae bacterium]|jgi:hypothetical protein